MCPQLSWVSPEATRGYCVHRSSAYSLKMDRNEYIVDFHYRLVSGIFASQS